MVDSVLEEWDELTSDFKELEVRIVVFMGAFMFLF